MNVHPIADSIQGKRDRPKETGRMRNDLDCTASPARPTRLADGRGMHRPDKQQTTIAPGEPARARKRFLKSFVYAYFGIVQVLATQRNMVVHCIIAIPTLLATQLLGFTPTENVIVLLCVALVLACEIINTSIENLGDVLSPEYHPAIRRAKDAAAAMVLISAIAAAAVGVVLFTSKGRLARLMRWDVEWRWAGSIDNVMVKLVFLGICWVFAHAWVYRRRMARAMAEASGDHPPAHPAAKG